MAFLTFRGGVHPYDGKELSKEKPITDYAPGKELVRQLLLLPLVFLLYLRLIVFLC